MDEAPWRRRFRAPRAWLPDWAELDPDHLVYGSSESGKQEIHAWDRRSGRRRRVTDRPEGTVRGRLDPAGTTIWWFDDDAGSEHGRWMVEPFTPGATPRPAAPDVPAAYASGLALGTGLAVIGSSTEAGSAFHLLREGAAARLIYRHDEEAWVAGLSRDGALLAMGHAEHGDSRHPASRVVDLEGATVAELWDGLGLSVTPGEWSPVDGDHRLLVHHERAGSSRPAIWAPETGTLVELGLELPGEVTSEWYPEAGALLLDHDFEGRTELYRYDLASGRLERLVTPPGTVWSARVRPDAELWVDWSDGATPPELRAGGGVLFRPEGPPAPPGVGYRDLRVGEVRGFLAEPAGPPPYPTIFLVHGGPEAHDRDAFSPRVQAWVDHGYAVVMVNYRGSSGYGRVWRDALQGNPGLTEVADLVAVRDHLVAAGTADPQRIVLAGRSWGGYLTLLGIGTHRDRWSLAIADVPVADYEAAFEDEMEPLKAFDRALFGGSPSERPDFYRARSPITYAAQVAVPVMILGGSNDPRCPIRQIHNYVECLRSLGKPVEFYEFGAGHASLVIEEQVRQVAAQIGFAARNLGTAAPL